MNIYTGERLVAYKLYLLSMIFGLTAALMAKTHIIEFGGSLGFNYAPADLEVTVGDTVTWQGSFSSHPLSSTDVPVGAAAFSNGSGTSFSYIVPVPGTYDYKCDLHAGLGMTGSFSAVVSSVERDNTGNIPSVFLLDQNYPNPFNPVTTIGYSLPFSGMVELTVYDVLGKNVATIVSERQSAGYHRVVWNAADQSSGVYFYHLKSGNHQAVRRMILMR